MQAVQVCEFQNGRQFYVTGKLSQGIPTGHLSCL